MRSSKDSLFLNIEEEKKRKTIRKTAHTLENYICSKRVQIKCFFNFSFASFLYGYQHTIIARWTYLRFTNCHHRHIIIIVIIVIIIIIY